MGTKRAMIQKNKNVSNKDVKVIPGFKDPYKQGKARNNKMNEYNGRIDRILSPDPDKMIAYEEAKKKKNKPRVPQLSQQLKANQKPQKLERPTVSRIKSPRGVYSIAGNEIKLLP